MTLIYVLTNKKITRWVFFNQTLYGGKLCLVFFKFLNRAPKEHT